MNPDSLQILEAVRGGTTPDHLATVVRTQGSCYRKPGARLAIAEGQVLAGSVSGGCVDPSLAMKASWMTRSGARILRLDTAAGGGEEDGLRYPGCGGTLSILLERSPGPVVEFLEERCASDSSGVMVTNLSAGGSLPLGARAFFSSVERGSNVLLERAQGVACQALAEGRSSAQTIETEEGDIDVFVEHIRPPTRLFIAGRHPDVHKLVDLALLMDWTVTVAGPMGLRRALRHRCNVLPLEDAAVGAALERHPESHVIVMTHSVSDDRRVVRAVARAGVRGYVGMLGPDSRRSEVFEPLTSEAGAFPRPLESIQSPAGLRLGGDGPEAIALSLVAGIQAHMHETVLPHA